MQVKPNLPEQIRELPDGIQPGAPDDSFMRGYRFGHRAARHAAARLAAAALSAAPAQEPLTMDQRYWLDRRTDIIAAMEAEGLQIWSDKDRVWLHRMSASPLPQEVKALTDSKIELLAKESGFGFFGQWQLWQGDTQTLLAFARAIEREVGGAQEGKAGEWLPIESAPKDGSSFLIWTKRLGFAVVSHDVDDPMPTGIVPSGHCLVIDDGKFAHPIRGDYPTHWQPLPPPPSATLAASREGEQR